MMFDIAEIDEDAIEEFMSSLYESFEGMEHELTILERNPTNEKAIHNLVLAVNLLKSHCRMCYFEPFIEFLDGVDSLLLAIRAEQVSCSDYVREFLLLSLDTFRHFVETLVQVHEMDLGPLLELGEDLSSLAKEQHDRADQFAVKMLDSMSTADEKASFGAVSLASLVVDESELDEKEQTQEAAIGETVALSPIGDTTALSGVLAPSTEADIAFFRSLAESLESRYLFWKMRSRRSLSLALSVNHFLEESVDESQLKAAIYMHDIGMLFVPDDVVNKTERLNSLEERMIKQHPTIGYEWLRRMNGWEEAAELVYAHHERPDGQGYPRGLTADQIPVGSQIIAVVDTYFSITRKRADRTHKKSLLRAVKEIHHHLGTQFTPEVANAMIQIVASMVVKKEDA